MPSLSLSLSLSVQTVHSVSAHPAAAAKELQTRPAEHLLIKVAHVIMAPPLCLSRPGERRTGCVTRKYGRHVYHDHEQLT